MRAGDRIERLLGLVPYLRRHPGVPVREAAEAFGVSPKELLGDLNALWMCGLPGGLPGDLIEIDMDAVETDGVIVLSNADYLARPLRLRPDEAVSLIAALQGLADLASGDAAAAVASAIDKLAGLMGGQSVPVSVAVESGSPGVRAALQDAIEHHTRVQITHSGRGGRAVVLVDPVRIEVVGGYAYLDAWSLDKQAWRSYRLDRVDEVAPLDEPAADHGTPPEPGAWFEAPSSELTLQLRPAAHWVVEYVPTLEVMREGDLITARFPVVDDRWAVSLVLRLGDAAEVVAPEGIRAAVWREAAAALANYA